MGETKNSNEKKRSQLLRFNVGGAGGVVLGGVVLLGGGLAVAGLMAAFSIIKNRNSGKDNQKQEDSTPSAGSQGLSSVLQNPSTAVHQNSCCTSHGTTTIDRTESLMDSKELVAAHNIPRVDKTLPIMDGEKEILYAELKKEINESYNETLNKEETSLPVPIKMIENDSSETLQPTQNIEIKREDEPAENLTMQSVKDEEQEQGEIDVDDGTEQHVVENKEEILERELALKENSPVQSVEEEEEEEEVDDDDDNNNHSGEEDDSEDVTEKEEESSEGTGSSSMDSNVEAIWPTEMIEVLSRELKEINSSNLSSGEKKIDKPESHDYINRNSDGSLFNDYGNNNETKNSAMLNGKTPEKLGMEKIQNRNLPKREVLVWSVVVVILLLLLLRIHRTVSVHDLSYQKSVVGPQV